jgi:pimeloyl-ACP methyl ester carboxylesterase
MGYSLGSFVALQTAIRHPDVVDRLVGLQLIEGRHHLRISVVVPHPRGQRDAGIDGSLRPANQFAIVPNTTRYTLAVEPMLLEIVERFLGTK